jgi:hypothetical protein
MLIWRIILTAQNTIIGETRDQSAKVVRFFSVDAYSGNPLWKGFQFDEPWWIGIETAYDSWLILHGFARPDMPEHRGIWMVDLATGKLLWKNNELTFWFISHQKLFAYKYIFDKRLGYEIDLSTGNILYEYGDHLDDLHELRKQAVQKESEDQQGILLPDVFRKGQGSLEVDAVIQKTTGGNALDGWTEYLLHENILIISYYQKEELSESAGLKNILSVYNLKRKISVFHEIIAHGLQIPSMDTFFVKNEYAYFIKNQNTLTALQPWKF